MDLQRTQIYLDKATLERLKVMAKEETERVQSKITVSTLIRRFLNDRIKSQ